MNLVINARDALPDGGQVTLSTTVRRAASDALESGDVVVLGVRDAGVGMSEEVRAQMFEPFFTTKSSGRGTGLGLATVRSIVGEASGTLRVQSAPGEGTLIELSRFGYDVHGFGSSELALASSVRPAVLVTDVILPGMDGLALAGRLAEGRPSLRVVFTTGYSGDPARGLDAREGAVVLYKPYRPSEVAAAIRRALSSTVP